MNNNATTTPILHTRGEKRVIKVAVVVVVAADNDDDDDGDVEFVSVGILPFNEEIVVTRRKQVPFGKSSQ